MHRNIRHVSSLFACIFISWSLYRYVSRFPGFVDDFIAKPLLWLPVVWYSVKCIEKKPLASIGLSVKQFKKNIIIGFIASFVLSVELVLSTLLRHSRIGLHVTPGSVFLLLVSSFATGFVEEVVFRGYIQSRLFTVFRSPLAPIGISSFLFTLVHFPIIIFVLRYSLSQMISYSFLLFVLGVINGYLFWRTKTLTASITVHTLWDIISGIVH